MRFGREVRAFDDIIPDGWSQDDVESELEDVREYLAQRRREAGVYTIAVLVLMWTVLGDSPLAFAAGVAGLLAMVAALVRLQKRKMGRLEQRGALVIEATKLGELESGSDSP